MKKEKKVAIKLVVFTIEILFIAIVSLITIYLIHVQQENKTTQDETNSSTSNNIGDFNSESSTMKAVIVQVNENNLMVMPINNDISLAIVSFAEEGNIGFKQGQEVLIDYDGFIDCTYPAGISHVSKIEIIKEKSSITIPDKLLKSTNLVTISIEEITNTRLTITIIDKNEKPYDYPDHYQIKKKVKNKDYTGKGKKVGEDTETTISGFTGTGPEYIYEEINNRDESKIQVVTNTTTGETKQTIDWTNEYGQLGSGEYVIESSGGELNISIKFAIEANGEAVYDKINQLGTGTNWAN